VHHPPLDPAGDRMLGPTRYGFNITRAPLLWELPGSEGGKREAMWRRRLDRMVGSGRLCPPRHVIDTHFSNPR
jgi:hypothetical protein